MPIFTIMDLYSFNHFVKAYLSSSPTNGPISRSWQTSSPHPDTRISRGSICSGNPLAPLEKRAPQALPTQRAAAAIEDMLRECSDVFSDTLDHSQTSSAVGDEGADDKDKESIATDTSSYKEEPPDASAIYEFSASEGTSKGISPLEIQGPEGF
jgi:hypothetical protein